MPDLDLNVKQGYDFKKNANAACGFITKLKIGGEEITADQQLKNFEDPDNNIPVVGVVQRFEWNEAKTDPITFDMRVSTKNKQKLSGLKSKLTKHDVEFEFVCVDYDDVQKQYYTSWHSNSTEMKSILQKNGDELNLDIAPTPSKEVSQPQNYQFTIGINPQGEQTIHCAHSIMDKDTMQWGLNT
jgi:hypothetical protein